MCREAGARVTTNVFIRDLGLAEFRRLDGRRIEVIADGLTLFQGAQLAIDTTMVSPLRRDGTTRRGAGRRPGVALEQARRTKEGRWSDETAQFLRCLAKAKAETAPVLIKNRVKAAWLRRWSSILACSAGPSHRPFLRGVHSPTQMLTSLLSMRFCGTTGFVDLFLCSS